MYMLDTDICIYIIKKKPKNVLEHFLRLQPGELSMSAITFAELMNIRPEIIIEAVMNMKKKERDSFLEDLLAATSPEYLKSIKEARDDYKAGRTKSHEEVFGH
jgi:predicted nucleic acid-binding protein